MSRRPSDIAADFYIGSSGQDVRGDYTPLDEFRYDMSERQHDPRDDRYFDRGMPERPRSDVGLRPNYDIAYFRARGKFRTSSVIITNDRNLEWYFE